MATLICLLRGINLGGNNLIKMDALRTLCKSLGFRNARTYIASGNIVFETDEKDLAALSEKVEKTLERKFGFRPEVILRTTSEMQAVIARNPFANRRGIEPNKLLVMFLKNELEAEAQKAALKIEAAQEEVRCNGRELYIYFPDGQGQSKLMPKLNKILKNSGTGRNWNTVTKLLEMADATRST